MRPNHSATEGELSTAASAKNVIVSCRDLAPLQLMLPSTCIPILRQLDVLYCANRFESLLEHFFTEALHRAVPCIQTEQRESDYKR